MKGQRVLVWLPVRGDRYASFFKEKNAATLVLIFWLTKKNVETLKSWLRKLTCSRSFAGGFLGRKKKLQKSLHFF